MLFAVIIGVKAQSNNKADIKFDKTTIDLGKITADSPIKNCYFTFTNTGDANLYIHQIITERLCLIAVLYLMFENAHTLRIHETTD